MSNENNKESAKDKISDMYRKVCNWDWKNPKVAVTAAFIASIPFVGGYYVNIGLFTGCLLAASALWIYDKLPIRIKKWCKNHLLLTDLLASTIMAVLVGKLFTAGLTLAIGVGICAVLLSVSLPFMPMEEEKKKKPAASTA